MSRIPEIDRELSLVKSRIQTEGYEAYENPYDFSNRMELMLKKYYEENGLDKYDDMWYDYEDKIREIGLEFWEM
jgi:hypothetical protein